MVDYRLTFKEHLSYADEKAEKVVAALAGKMVNIEVSYYEFSNLTLFPIHNTIWVQMYTSWSVADFSLKIYPSKKSESPKLHKPCIYLS